jgi:hypothetical protein
VKADQGKAKMEQAAAEATASAEKQRQFDQVAALEDAMQAEDDAQSLGDLRPDLQIGHKSASNTDVDTLSDSHLMLDDPVRVAFDALIDPPSERGSYRESSHSDNFLTGWEEVGDRAVMVKENNEEEEKDYVDEEEEEEYVIHSEDDSASEASAVSQEARKKSGRVRKTGKKTKHVRGNFRAAVNNTRQVLPPPPSQSKKRKGPEPPPPVEANTSTKRTRTTEPGGLVRNWKRDVSILEHTAHKHVMEFVDDEDDLADPEGEFDRAEGPGMLNAVRASKPSTVRIDSKLVRGILYY